VTQRPADGAAVSGCSRITSATGMAHDLTGTPGAPTTSPEVTGAGEILGRRLPARQAKRRTPDRPSS
jgi:hypothetical protein